MALSCGDAGGDGQAGGDEAQGGDVAGGDVVAGEALAGDDGLAGEASAPAEEAEVASIAESAAAEVPTESTGPALLEGLLSEDRALGGDVRLTAGVVVAGGVTLTLLPGTLVTVVKGAGLEIEGTLVAQGTEAAPVRFEGTGGTAGDWTGIVIKPGGNVLSSYAVVHDAALALDARVGSDFTLDHLRVENCTLVASLRSSGTLSYGTFLGIGADQVDGPVLVQDASPVITDSRFDQANLGVDMITVLGATSAPRLSYVDITGAHCAVHANEGTGMVIDHSNLYDVQYAIMVIASQGMKVTHSNLAKNANNIGLCVGGTVQADGTFFDGAPFDASCAGQGNTGPAAVANTDVGPR